MVYRIKKELDKRGILTWIGEFQIGIGESIRQEIDKAIVSSNFLILFLSKKAVESVWVQQEIDAAFMKEMDSRDINIIPVLLEKCNIPSTLKAKRYIDLRPDFRKGVVSLIDALMYPRYLVLQALTAKWIGKSGVLYLSVTGTNIVGKYDWQDEKSGNIRGHLEKNRIKFNWSWDYSPEHGMGIFILDDTHRRLEGGWWFSDVDIDPDESLELLNQQDNFHPWSFDKEEISKKTVTDVLDDCLGVTRGYISWEPIFTHNINNVDQYELPLSHENNSLWENISKIIRRKRQRRKK